MKSSVRYGTRYCGLLRKNPSATPNNKESNSFGILHFDSHLLCNGWKNDVVEMLCTRYNTQSIDFSDIQYVYYQEPRYIGDAFLLYSNGVDVTEIDSEIHKWLMIENVGFSYTYEILEDFMSKIYMRAISKY